MFKAHKEKFEMLAGFAFIVFILWLVFGGDDLPNSPEEIKAHTTSLIQQLESTSDNDLQKRVDIYDQLNRMHPDNTEYKNTLTTLTARLDRKKMIERQFSAWDGSHRKLERLVKKMLDNPDSFEHVQTSAIDRGEHLLVEMQFRASNVYGAIVKDQVLAEISLDGDTIEFVDSAFGEN